MVERFKGEVGEDSRVIGTGGLAEVIVPGDLRIFDAISIQT